MKIIEIIKYGLLGILLGFVLFKIGGCLGVSQKESNYHKEMPKDRTTK